ncbi:MAG: TatD family hydrolase [bacterium]|nr:TatD family hydrolase [bacterium]
MIDSHTHLIAEDTDEYADRLIKLMDENGVRATVLFGIPGEVNDTEVEKYVVKHKNRFIPFSSSIDFNIDSIGTYLKKLGTGYWKGVGEVFLDCTDDEIAIWKTRQGDEHKHLKPVPKEKEENPVFKRIFEYCGNTGLPIMVHCMDAEVLRRALGNFKQTKFIWAHADFGVWYTVVESLMNEFNNLYCDFGVQFRFEGKKWLSGKADNWLIDKAEGWRKICQLFPERVMWGTDRFTWDDLDSDSFRISIGVWEKFSQPLSSSLANNISEGNIVKLTKWDYL